jgi:hypothetical protein
VGGGNETGAKGCFTEAFSAPRKHVKFGEATLEISSVQWNQQNRVDRAHSLVHDFL